MKSTTKGRTSKKLSNASKPEELKTDVPTSSTAADNINLDTNMLIIESKNDFPYILKEIGNRLLLVEFFAPWCGPCKSMGTKLEDLANSYKGKILLVKIDVDEFEELTLEYNISAIPTFVLLKNQKKLEQFSSSNLNTLTTSLEKHAGKPELNDESVEEVQSEKVTTEIEKEKEKDKDKENAKGKEKEKKKEKK